MTHKELSLKYTDFYTEFKRMHKELEEEGLGNNGHGIDHDIMVASYSLLIGGDKRVSELAWVASLLHSIDRFYGERTKKISLEILEKTGSNLNTKEKEEILDAVLNHSQPNDDTDSETLVILKDADRLANISPLILIRAGQFRPNIPAIEFEYRSINKNPKSTHQNPCSVKDNILSHLEWESGYKVGLRTERAREIGKPYFDFLRQFLSLVEHQLNEVGLY